MKYTWDKNKFKQHQRAADLLCKIKDDTFQFISDTPDVTEYEVQQFIIKKYKENNMRSSDGLAIAAFRESTSNVHYFPKKKSCKKLKPESLIMIDLWARLDEPYSPFADITWMAYYGKEIPKEINKAWGVVASTRDKCLNHIEDYLKKNEMPVAKEVEEFSRKLLRQAGYGDNIKHFLGHSLGFHSPHGKAGRFSDINDKPILKEVGYTDEPGVYIKNKFGIRSEIDFFITNENKIVVTTEVQREITILS